MDVDDDGDVTALDALVVINRLNDASTVERSAVRNPASTSMPSASPAVLSMDDSITMAVDWPSLVDEIWDDKEDTLAAMEPMRAQHLAKDVILREP